MSASAKLRETPIASDGAPAGPARTFRGKNKGKRWKRGEGTELAVIRLPLDVHDAAARRRVEQLYSAM